MRPLALVIVTGQSGSGKSTAIRALEDEGYYCIDNLPTQLVTELIRVVSESGTADRMALVMDARNPSSVRQMPELVRSLRRTPHRVRLVYLEATEPAMLRRYSETRRRHPLDDGCGLREAIRRERELLSPLRELADDTLDSSAMSPHELRERVTHGIAGALTGERLRVAVQSFGFKHGLPLEADLVLDVRFLANPYFVDELRAQTGRDAPVRDYVLALDDTNELVKRASHLLEFLLPRYQREGKRYLTLAIGCTGGKHRSVVVAETLARWLESTGLEVDLRHRDIEESKR